MRNNTSLLELLAILAGGLIAYGGWRLSAPWLLNIGLAVTSLGIIAFGVDAMRTREDTYSIGDTEMPQTQTYSGFAAIMSGLLMAMIGFAILVYALIALLGLQDRFLGYVSVHPGIALLFGGIMMVAFSFTLVLGSLEDRRSVWSLLGSLPARVFGLALLLVGIALILLGGFEVVSPVRYDALMDTLRTWVPRPPV